MLSSLLSSYIVPGTPDNLGNPTLPPVHAFLLSAFGDYDVTNPAEIKYVLSSIKF